MGIGERNLGEEEDRLPHLPHLNQADRDQGTDTNRVPKIIRNKRGEQLHQVKDQIHLHQGAVGI